MFSICFSHQSRFKQIMERQEPCTSLSMYCLSKTEISIFSPCIERQCVVSTSLFTSCLKKYELPTSCLDSGEPITFRVYLSELCEVMSKCKENHNSSIHMSCDLDTEEPYINIDFINDDGEKTIPSESVRVIKNFAKYKIAKLPDISSCSLLYTNAKELKRIFTSESLFSKKIQITMKPNEVIFAAASDIGTVEYRVRHVLDIEDYKGYNEDDVFSTCPKSISDTNTIVMKPEHKEFIQQEFKLIPLAFSESPTTKSNRVILGLSTVGPSDSNQIMILQYKIVSFGFVTYYFGDDIVKL